MDTPEQKCKWCDAPTNDGPECNRCWELRHRIEQAPQLASEIMQALIAEGDNENREGGHQ